MARKPMRKSVSKNGKNHQPIRLRLYIAGSAPNSTIAQGNLRALCAELAGPKIEIVDVLQEPGRALRDRIMVTPTLLKLGPLPKCRVVGNLSDTAHVLASLGVTID